MMQLRGRLPVQVLWVAVVLVFVQGMSAPPSAAQPRPVGEVAAMSGSAQVTHQGGRRAEALAVAAPVFEGDVIHTDADSRLKLEFVDDTVTLLGEETTLTVTRFVYSAEQSSRASILTTTFGFVRAIVSKLVPQSTVEVRTVTAVASVRSTDWIVEAGPDSTAVVVLDGAVAVRSANEGIDGAVVLEPGEGTVVPIGRAPTPSSRWGQPRIDRAIAATRSP